jgi:hypothetical protein
VNTADLYFVNQEIACRELKGEYLIFSGLTRQTLVVEVIAFKLVNLLKMQSRNFDEILTRLATDDNPFNDEELASFVSTSLDQLVDFGVLDCSQTK